MIRYLMPAALLLLPQAMAVAAEPEQKPKPVVVAPVALPAGVDPTDTLAAMIAAAYRSGDDATINAVVGVAKATFPDQMALIDRLAAGDAAVLAQTRKEEQAREQTRIEQARFFEIWKGELEAGASRSTGTTRQAGAYASAKLERDGLKWRQKLTGRLDLQQTDNVTTTERLIAAWQPNYKLSDRFYTYGLAQYEHDRTLGYDHRFTGGAGIGFTPIDRGGTTIELEAGPAIRRTYFTELSDRTTLAARASLSAHLAITPTLTFSQEGALFVESRDTTASATTSLDTKLIGALKARFSYNIQYEEDAPVGSHPLDTVTRATLVYDF